MKLPTAYLYWESSFVFKFGLGCFYIDALSTFQDSLALIRGNYECVIYSSVSFPLTEMVVMVAVSCSCHTFRHEPGLSNQTLILLCSIKHSISERIHFQMRKTALEDLFLNNSEFKISFILTIRALLQEG